MEKSHIKKLTKKIITIRGILLTMTISLSTIIFSGIFFSSKSIILRIFFVKRHQTIYQVLFAVLDESLRVGVISYYKKTKRYTSQEKERITKETKTGTVSVCSLPLFLPCHFSLTLHITFSLPLFSECVTLQCSL